MNIFKIKTLLLDSNMYILEEQQHLIVIDPYWDDRVEVFLKNLNAKIDFVYLTHEHYDHISGIKVFQRQYNANIFCSNVCAIGISDPRKNHTHYFDAFSTLQSSDRKKKHTWMVPPTEYQADIVFEKQHRLSWQEHDLYFFETPGHSKGSSSLIVDNKWLFCGDSLTLDARVLTRFPGGSAQDLYKITFPLFSKLPKAIWVFPGHYDLFRLDQIEEFL